jgi:hypothetical protein
MVAGMQRPGPVGSRWLARVFRHPVHPALAHLPVGAWACGLVFDIASQVVRRPTFLALGSRWLIAIGVLSAVVAAGTGFVDLGGKLAYGHGAGVAEPGGHARKDRGSVTNPTAGRLVPRHRAGRP